MAKTNTISSRYSQYLHTRPTGKTTVKPIDAGQKWRKYFSARITAVKRLNFYKKFIFSARIAASTRLTKIPSYFFSKPVDKCISPLCSRVYRFCAPKPGYCQLFVPLLLTLVSSAAYPQPLDILDLPSRPAGAKTGSQFKDQVLNLSREAREVAIYREVTTGNVPDFMRNLKPVTINATISGQPRSGTVYVTPEYLAIGSNADYFRMPMTPILAQWIADATSTVLPTRKIVNATWTAAPCKLPPAPIPPSAAMVTVPVFWDHQLTVQAQRAGTPNPLGDLVGGHKKDVIITPRIHDPTTSNRVAIYGWHQTNGSPIQPIYLGHGETYADYSHGIRLVNSRMLLDNATVTVQDVLTSSAVSTLLNDEGIPFTASAPPRYDAGSPPSAVEDWATYN